MSLLNKASLIQIPSGYKDGTLYSAKPTNGDGDFTFSRGSNLAATRVNSEGLIEKGRENLLLQSNQFDTTWSLSNASVTSGQSGYDGSSDAWLFETTVAGAAVQQSFTSTGVLTYSVYAKAGSVNGIRLRIDASTDGNGYFDLSNGTVFDFTGINASIIDVGNGWYRCSLSQNVSSPVKIQFFTTDGTISYDNGNILIQDAQLELGLVATDYIETGASTAQAGILEDMPRLDYSGGATCGHLLLEPQRSNVITQSEYFDSSYYTKSFATITTNSTISPDGKQNASELVEDTSNNRHLFFNTSAISGSSSPYTVSIFLKQNTRRYAFLQIATDNASKRQTIVIDLSDGSITDTANTGSPIGVSYNVESFSNGFYRASLTATNTSGGVYIVCGLSNSATPTYNSSKEPIYTGNGSSIYIYGAMLEAGSYATSYIPTYGASVTRSHDVCKITGTDATDIINQPAMTLFVEAQLDDNGATTILSMLRDLTGGLYNDFISLTYTNSLKVNFEVRENASPQATIQSGVLSEGVHKIAAVLTSTSMKLFIDGSLENSATITAIPDDLDEIYLAGYPDTTARFGTKKQFLFFPTALSDDECIQLTTL